MKKIISTVLALSMCFICMTGCNDLKDNNDISSQQQVVYTPHKFSQEDTKLANGIALGMTVAQVEEILGAADDNILSENDNFIYGAYRMLKYDALTLTFYDVSGGDEFTLGVIHSSSEKDIFPQGLHVNSSKDDVLAAFTQDEQNAPLYFDHSEESYGDYIYGNTNENFFVEDKPKTELQYAYINNWSVINGYDNEYMMEYYYWHPLAWTDDGEGYTGDNYSMVFYMDSETDLVKSISLNYDYRS